MGSFEFMTNTLGERENYANEYFPENHGQLLKIIRQLNSDEQEFHVVSRGNNWGYGCKNSHIKNSSLVSLEKMNKIIDFDRADGVIVLEPGVTYFQLSQFLEKNAPEWIAPVHGGGPECSVIGNVLERGYGITPIMDHFSACIDMHVILPNGREFSSSLRSIGQNNLASRFKYGVGPYLDGIFTQSNLGIVSKMTLRLSRRSQEIELFFFSIDNSQLMNATCFIKKLKREFQDNIGGINLMNKERVLSMLIDYPQELVKKREAISDEQLNSDAKKNLIHDWTIVGSIYGSKSVVKAVKKEVVKKSKMLKGRKVFLTQSKINFLLKVNKILPAFIRKRLSETLNSLKGLIDILNGIPQNTAIKLAYWKNLTKKPEHDLLHPRLDNCGLIWYAPLVEMKPDLVINYIQMVKRVSQKYKFNSIITLTTIDDLCFDSTIPILFNKDDELDKKRAHEYFQELLSEGEKLGFYPYRLGTNSLPSYLAKLDDNYKDLLVKIKKTVDDKNLFANGRYIEINRQ